MKTRYDFQDTAWGRLAVVAALITRKRYFERPQPEMADAKDFEEVFESYVRRELIMARILQESGRTESGQRIAELRAELLSIEKHIESHPL